MRRIFFRDILKTILRQKVSFVSIFVIATLAVTAYLGINFGSAALKNNAADFYRKLNYRDFEITSTKLITPTDLEELKNVEGVADVEGMYQTSGYLVHGDERQTIYIASVTERINLTKLVTGRLPAAHNECVLEAEIMERLNLKIGDTVSLQNTKGEAAESLLEKDFVISGSVICPDYYAGSVYVPGDRNVLVMPGAFDQEKLENCFMKALIVMDKPEGISVFDKKYEKLRSEMKEKLETIGDARAEGRTEEIRKKAEDTIAEKQQELDDGKRKLDDGRRQLDENTAKLQEAEQALWDGKALLDQGKAELDSAEVQLQEGWAKLESGKAELDSAAALLSTAETELPNAKAQLDAVEAQLAAGRQELDAAKSRLEEGEAQLKDGLQATELFKMILRLDIQDICKEAAGPEKSEQIQWTESDMDPDSDPLLPEDPSFTIREFAITDHVSENLEGSLHDFAEKIFRSFVQEEEVDVKPETLLETFETSEEYPLFVDAVEEFDQQAQAWDTGYQEYLTGKDLYLQKEAEYAAGYEAYQNGLLQYDEKYLQYLAGKVQYEIGYEEYQSGLKLWQEMKEKYDTGRVQYSQKLAEFENGAAKIASGKAELAEGEAEYQKRYAEYEDGKAKIDQARKDMEKLSPCRWVILDVTGNGGFQHAKNSAENVGKLGMTFAMLFVLVGALIIYVTTGRIIEEQRQLVGTQKALGFYNKEILLKYLLFAGIATLIGILLGVVLAYFGIQFAVLRVHQPFYVTGKMPYAFLPVLSLIVLAAGLLVACASAAIACYRLIAIPARELMQDKMPEVKKKKKGKNEGGKGLYSRLILRNILSDKLRVIVTIISIAGCCTLLMIGFTLNYGVTNAIRIHFNGLVKYDGRLVFDPHYSDDIQETMENKLKEFGVDYAPAVSGYRLAKLKDHDDSVELVCMSTKDMNRFFTFQDWKTGKELSLPSSGTLFQHRIAETANLSVGDPVTIYDGNMNPFETKVAGISKLYFGRGAFMSLEAYREIFGEEPQYNSFYFKGGDLQKVEEELSKMPGFASFTSRAAVEKTYSTVAKGLTAVTLILIVAAGLMAYFILLNLINMYLSQKKRELTIMRVNGFTSKEVIRYVSGESVLTTILGIVLGLALGALMGYLILRFLEQPHAGFDRDISVQAIIFSTAITGIFSFAINAFGLRKVKKLKLTDVSE